eukprot:6044453-Pyramimonas_sp.AAC.1
MIAPISAAVVPLPSLMAGVPGGLKKVHRNISEWSTPFGAPIPQVLEDHCDRTYQRGGSPLTLFDGGRSRRLKKFIKISAIGAH